LSFFLVPILELQHAPPPPKCYEPGNVPQLLILPLFSPFGLTVESIKEFGGASQSASLFVFLGFLSLNTYFLVTFTFCGKINIDHIHICNDCLCLNNSLNLYYYHSFPMKHFLHLSKLWIIYRFMSIQTTYVVSIWKCFLWFLNWLWCLYDYHCGLLLFFLHVSTLWFIIPQFVQCLLVFLVLLYVFTSVVFLVLCGVDNVFLAFVVVIPSSHKIVTSLWCCIVDCFILVVAILKYDCKPILNTIVIKLSIIGTCKPWASFWICS
jgi:hypothetical protein